MDEACGICRNSENNKFHTAREMMFGRRDEFVYLECGECGTLQLTDIPDLSKYYPPEYLAFESEAPAAKNALRRAVAGVIGKHYVNGSSLLGRVAAAAIPKFGRQFLPALRQYPLKLDFDTRILDFGCGSGRLLRTLRAFGFHNLKGADAYIDNEITYPCGLKIDKAGLDSLQPGYDLIILQHSFEHLPNPLESLRLVRGLLAKDGYAMICIPLVNYAWERYGVNWVQLDAPRHLFLFTERSFRRLADEAGMEIEAATYDSTDFQFWGSEQYAMDIPLTPNGGARLRPGFNFGSAKLKEWQREAYELNAAGRGDSATFYLKARD